MERITVNLNGPTRRATLHGREMIVANGTFIVPGVLPGSDGPLFYPPDEVALDPSPWNGMPIVGYHPVRNGVHTSARHPDILESQGLGWVFEAKTGSALGGELWFDVQNVRKFDATLPAKHRILPRLERGEPIELSTGLRVTKTPAPAGATHNGRPYTHVARGYSPDHVAILPDQQGACSVADKCGVNVTANEAPMNRRSIWQRLGEALGITANDDATANCGGKGGKPGPCPGTKRGGGKGKSKGKAKSKKKKRREPDPLNDGLPTTERQHRKIKQGRMMRAQFRAAGLAANAADLLDAAPLTKPEAIDILVANCACWQGGDADRATLNGLPDDKVIALAEEAEDAAEDAAVANAARDGFVATSPGAYVFNAAAGGFVANDDEDDDEDEDDPEDDDEDEEDEEDEPPPPPKRKHTRNQAVTTPATTTKPKTAAEWFAEAPPEVQSAVRNAIDIEAREKAAIVDRMVANVADGDGKTALRTRLMAKPIDELRDLLQIAPPQAAPANPFDLPPVANYAGANGGTAPTAKDDSDNVLPVITVNWDEQASPKLRRKQA